MVACDELALCATEGYFSVFFHRFPREKKLVLKNKKCSLRNRLGEAVSTHAILTPPERPLTARLPHAFEGNGGGYRCAYHLVIWRGSRIIRLVQRAYVVLENGTCPQRRHPEN